MRLSIIPPILPHNAPVVKSHVFILRGLTNTMPSAIVVFMSKTTINITLDEAYEQIKDYFSRDGAQLSRNDSYEPEDMSWGVASSCFYRHPVDGRACAAGCLIPDDLYDESMESYTARSLEVFSDLEWHVKQFIDDAQKEHDKATGVDTFLEMLLEVYEDYSRTLKTQSLLRSNL